MRRLIKKVSDAYWNVKAGVANLIRWAPIIWRDRWWDWMFLADIMEYKLKHDAQKYEKIGWTAGKNRTARQMKICAELLHRLSNETAHDKYLNDESFWEDKDSEKSIKKRMRAYKEADELENFYQDYLFTIMKKHFRCWWD